MKLDKFKQLLIGSAIALSLSSSAFAANNSSVNSSVDNVSQNKFQTSSIFKQNISELGLQDRKALDNETIMQRVTINDEETFESFISKKKENMEVAQTKIAEQLQEQLSDYQKLGLYKNIKTIQFFPTFVDAENSALLDINLVVLKIDPHSSLKKIQLEKESSAGLSFKKVLAHELSHVQFNANPTLLENNEDIANLAVNAQINTILPLSTFSPLNNSKTFVQENMGDAYGELAYMKMNNFSKESIDELKKDIEIRESFVEKYKSIGDNVDPHDTVATLKTILELVSNQDNLEKLRSLPGENFDDLAKSIVYNTYKDYLSKDSVQAAIKENISKHRVDDFSEKLITAINNDIKLPEKFDIKNRLNSLRNKYSTNSLASTAKPQ